MRERSGASLSQMGHVAKSVPQQGLAEADGVTGRLGSPVAHLSMRSRVHVYSVLGKSANRFATTPSCVFGTHFAKAASTRVNCAAQTERSGSEITAQGSRMRPLLCLDRDGHKPSPVP